MNNQSIFLIPIKKCITSISSIRIQSSISNNDQDIKHVPPRFIINENEIVLNAGKQEIKKTMYVNI